MRKAVKTMIGSQRMLKNYLLVEAMAREMKHEKRVASTAKTTSNQVYD